MYQYSSSVWLRRVPVGTTSAVEKLHMIVEKLIGNGEIMRTEVTHPARPETQREFTARKLPTSSSVISQMPL